MATYKVNYYIKRNNREIAASHIIEARNAKEAIKKTKAYTDEHRLPHPFRPKATKLSDLDLTAVGWKKDTITANYVRDNAEKLASPKTMTPVELAEATTYCDSCANPYAGELISRAEMDDKLETENAGKVLRDAAKHFGVMLF